MRIVSHRVEGAPYVPTKKKGGTIVPRYIVLHYTAGWTTPGDIATLATSDRQASAHGVLARDGSWTQIVPFNVKAWHAGPSKFGSDENLNNSSIGIEISNAGWIKLQSNKNFADQYGQQITPTGQFVGQSRRTPKESPPPSKWPSLTHPRLANGNVEGLYYWEPYPPAQLDALEELVAALLKKYPTIKRIVSHEEIDTRGWKTDPGGLMPMRRYQKLLESRNDPEPAKESAKQPAKTPVPVPETPIIPPTYTPPQPAKEPAKVLPWYKRWNLIWR